MFQRKKDIIYVVLAGIFITNALVAELIGGKLIHVANTVMSLGILPWPIVFITTDLINEYFGEKGDGLISDEQFNAVFGQSMWIIVGSITAFLVSQLIDVTIFHFVKNRTGKKMLWLRSTGSTVISQLFDSFIVLGIAFWLPGKIDSKTFVASAFTGYSVKLGIAICLTPLIYLGHYLIDNYLGAEKHGN